MDLTLTFRPVKLIDLRRDPVAVFMTNFPVNKPSTVQTGIRNTEPGVTWCKKKKNPKEYKNQLKNICTKCFHVSFCSPV